MAGLRVHNGGLLFVQTFSMPWNTYAMESGPTIPWISFRDCGAGQGSSWIWVSMKGWKPLDCQTLAVRIGSRWTFSVLRFTDICIVYLCIVYFLIYYIHFYIHILYILILFTWSCTAFASLYLCKSQVAGIWWPHASGELDQILQILPNAYRWILSVCFQTTWEDPVLKPVSKMEHDANAHAWNLLKVWFVFFSNESSWLIWGRRFGRNRHWGKNLPLFICFVPEI